MAIGADRAGADRERLGRTFDQAAELYRAPVPSTRPTSTSAWSKSPGWPRGSHLLEIGCATGKATLPLARMGFRITCLEPGRALAGQARRALRQLDVEVVESSFEEWQPGGERFSLVYAATAWHWLDPDVRYQKAADILEYNGFLALWAAGHVIPYDGDPFFEQIQAVYNEIGEGLPSGASLPRPGALVDDRAEIESTGLFEVIEVRQYDWETVYDTEGYIDLLNTFSGHISMEPWQRERLYGESAAGWRYAGPSAAPPLGRRATDCPGTPCVAPRTSLRAVGPASDGHRVACQAGNGRGQDVFSSAPSTSARGTWIWSTQTAWSVPKKLPPVTFWPLTQKFTSPLRHCSSDPSSKHWTPFFKLG